MVCLTTEPEGICFGHLCVSLRTFDKYLLTNLTEAGISFQEIRSVWAPWLIFWELGLKAPNKQVMHPFAWFLPKLPFTCGTLITVPWTVSLTTQICPVQEELSSNGQWPPDPPSTSIWTWVQMPPTNLPFWVAFASVYWVFTMNFFLQMFTDLLFK
jgi:hypothetical protein